MQMVKAFDVCRIPASILLPYPNMTWPKTGLYSFGVVYAKRPV
jgi:hypothetical protein